MLPQSINLEAQTMKLFLNTISVEAMDAQRRRDDAAWRGLFAHPCTQQLRPPEVPIRTVDLGHWGRVNSAETELESTLK